MKVIFNIEYQTIWGQILYLTGSLDTLGNFDENKAVPMRYNGNGHWTYEMEISQDDIPFEYRYLVKEYDNVINREWGDNRTLYPENKTRHCLVYDHWNEQPEDKSFYSSAFVDGIFSRNNTHELKPYPVKTLTLKVWAPTILPDQVVAIVDRSSGWDVTNPKILDDSAYPLWTISIPVENITFPYEYKFVILKKSDNTLIGWETGDNRTVNISLLTDNECVVVSGMHLHNPLPGWKGTGVAIPVFSLRTEQSLGIGDFVDLRKMVDWAAETGMRIIQILPVNDTTMTHTWVDSYPYNANSIFALHPNYLRVEEIGTLKDTDAMQRYEELKKELNTLSEIDYERVSLAKEAYIKAIFSETGKETLESEAFKTFFAANKEWLIPYAAFCCLRDRYGTPDFTQWKEHSTYDKAAIQQFCAPGNTWYDDIARTYYVQYHLARQLKETRDYAHKKGIVLKGDIPIGISRHSADAWSHTSLFHMDSQAGAPPDAFSVMGQNWGFPTYNWPVMEKDNYTWWKARFRKMAEYFDAYRIDHILGFFRIWQIPEYSVQGLMGHFNPALPYTLEEMQSYGFYFSPYRHARPYIRPYMLDEIFGQYADEVMQKYLVREHDGSYTLLPEVNTQRKIEQLMEQEPDETRRTTIRNGLFALVADVLFLEDPQRKNHWHPRISAQYTYGYKALSDYEKWCFNRLYDEFFYKRHDEFWKQEALKKLPPLISSTRMLVCGEDLGMIPHCVPEVMHKLQILSLEIQRMPKEANHNFADTWHYPYLSVCTTSTHDMSTLRAWWEENREQTQQFYNHVLHLQGEAPAYCEPWICEKIIDMQLESPSMWVILPLQDWLSTDGTIRRQNPQEERINIPANSRHYWRYRMHLTLEELLNKKSFNQMIKRKIRYFNR